MHKLTGGSLFFYVSDMLAESYYMLILRDGARSGDRRGHNPVNLDPNLNLGRESTETDLRCV